MGDRKQPPPLPAHAVKPPPPPPPPRKGPTPYAETLAFLERVAADFARHAASDFVAADTVAYCRVAAEAVRARMAQEGEATPAAERGAMTEESLRKLRNAVPDSFVDYMAKNYSGDVTFSDPAWHARRIWWTAVALMEDVLAARVLPRDTPLCAHREAIVRDAIGWARDTAAAERDGAENATSLMARSVGLEVARKYEALANVAERYLNMPCAAGPSDQQTAQAVVVTP